MKLALRNDLTLFLLYLLSCTAFASKGFTQAIIPLPEKMEFNDGNFQLHPATRFLGLHIHHGTQIFLDSSSVDTGQYLSRWLGQSTGYTIPVIEGSSETAGAGDILLTTNGANADLGPEGYELTVTTN